MLQILFLLTVPLLQPDLPADLVMIERDVRSVCGEDWFEALDVVFRDRDYFVALSTDPGSIRAGSTILLEGPFRLEDIALVHISGSGGAMELGLIGEPILVRGDIAIVNRPGDASPFTGLPDIRLVSPLRVIRTPAIPSILPAGGQDGMIDEMVSAVSEDSIMAVIQHLEDYGTRLCITDEYDQAAAWVDTWFGLHWIQSDQQWFYFYGDQMSNVVAEIPGQISPDSIYIICGHLDSITWPMEDTAPGADDNASGSATVLEAARVMAPYNFRYTLRFICFAAEEVGLVGSDLYAQTASAAGDEILGVINLDMILYAPAGYDSLWIPYDDQSEALAQAVAGAMGSYVPGLDVVTEYDPSATYSDHSSFWNYGYPAVLGIEYAVDDNPYYHSTTDLLANYSGDWPFGTMCVRASVAALASLAQPVGPSGIPGGGSPGDAVLLSISPNPASGSVFVSLPGASSGEVLCEVYDILGRTAAAFTMEGGTSREMDVSGLPCGVYLVRWAHSGSAGSSRLVVID